MNKNNAGDIWGTTFPSIFDTSSLDTSMSVPVNLNGQNQWVSNQTVTTTSTPYLNTTTLGSGYTIVTNPLTGAGIQYPNQTYTTATWNVFTPTYLFKIPGKEDLKIVNFKLSSRLNNQDKIINELQISCTELGGLSKNFKIGEVIDMIHVLTEDLGKDKKKVYTFSLLNCKVVELTTNSELEPYGNYILTASTPKNKESICITYEQQVEDNKVKELYSLMR
jgi:hypothetical protein